MYDAKEKELDLIDIRKKSRLIQVMQFISRITFYEV